MKILLLLILIQIFQQIQGQCSGGIWPIENANIGSFKVSWRYNIALNTVQFLVQGHVNSSINLTSTYISIGWSNTALTTNDTDIAVFFPNTKLIEDRYSYGDIIPLTDTQQDFCLIQTNISKQNIYYTFERYSTTGDVNDIDFNSNVSLTFFMGFHTISNNLQPPFFHQSLSTSVNLIQCISSERLQKSETLVNCSTKNCSKTSCSCLQEIGTNHTQCICFPPSFCRSGSAISSTLTITSSSISALINGFCQNKTNSCSSNGICLQISSTQFLCQCKPEYTGVHCQISLFPTDILNSCQCLNGGICSSNGTCLCPNGYIGTHCEMIDSCLSNPCNQGTCLPSSNCSSSNCDYSCLCSNGTTGQNCDIEADPCWSNPCQNNGSCIVSSHNYTCKCLSPYGGTNCELMMDVCTPNPCLNEGKCIHQNDTYRCDFVNKCLSSPCQNGGQCVASTENCSSTTCPISCICPNGTTGVFCEEEEDDDLCSKLSCLNGGTCLIDEIKNVSYCQCPVDTTGTQCETVISHITPCSYNPCGHIGTCIEISNSSYYCVCSNGLTGPSCSSNNFTSCADSRCHYLSTCQEIENTHSKSYECICPKYLTGDRCQHTNVCHKKPCLNQGTCLPLGPQNSFVCLCPPGFGHFDCSIYLGLSCESNVCLNGGVCDRSGSNIRCICPVEFAGPRCEWTSVCSANTCQNGGICRQIGPTMAECLCEAGYTGPTCSLRDSCTTLPCQNGGGCTTLIADTGTNWSAYRCICPLGFYGQNCDTKISSCSNMVCPPYKICSEQPSEPVCTCPRNKVGPFCQYDNPCSSSISICQNSGTCISSNTDPPVSSCLCLEGYTGRFCERIIETNPCTSNPCQTRGYCALSSSNKTYTCVCQENFTGEQCERSNPCVSSPCLNQGICQTYYNRTDTWFDCRCVGTFSGQRCETSLLNPCGGLCMNGSPCDNGVCICPAQYTGTFCGFENPCYNRVCKNDGLCSIISNATSVSFTCTCPSTYTGQYCEISLINQMNNQCVSNCQNNGSCVKGICMCTSDYIGPACQYKNPCKKKNPCLNNGTCFGRYETNGTLSTQCFCSEKYTGNSCESILCSSSSCNGGICRATQNSFVCVCSTGKFGDRCQYHDACATKPCLPTERCEQVGNQYQCISCYDQSSYCSIYQLRNEYCDNRYTILVDGNFLPVPQACRRSCGQCIPVQRFKDISSLFLNSTVSEQDRHLSSSMMTTTTKKTDIQLTKCIDKRDDCLMQKAYGFCRIFNEKYPEDCVKTCHPDCANRF